MPLTLDEARRVIEATSATTHLLQLDEIWTAAAAQSGSPSQSDRERDRLDQAGALVDYMDDLLDDVARHGGWLGEFAKQHAGDGEEVLSDLLWSDLLSPDDRSALRWWTGRHGGFAAMAEAVAKLKDDVGAEHAALAHQLELLRSGAPATGDLSRKFRCGAAQQLMVGGVLLVPGVVGGGVALGLAVGAAAATVVASTGGLGALAIIGGALWWAKRHHC